MVHIVMTTKCNNNCISCINEKKIRKGEMPIEMFDHASICNLQKNEIISIGGGEPTIYSGFFELMHMLAKHKHANKNAEILLLSNARAFASPNFLNRFRQINLPHIRIASAVYGHNAQLHDAITRTPGSFDQTIAGIKNLVNSGYSIEARVIINKLNYRHLEDISKLIDSLRVSRISFISMKVTGEALQNANALIVKFNQVVPYLNKAIAALKDSKAQILLLHFPHCVLPEPLHTYSGGRTIEDDQIAFKPECKNCKHFLGCSGVWKSYAEVVGIVELNPE